MNKKISVALSLLAFFAVAAAALAQYAERNTAAPTKNDLKLRLTEPQEGQTITGSSVRVAVQYDRRVFASAPGASTTTSTMPRPTFDVYVDNKLAQSLKEDSNAATIDNLSAGQHKVVVMAKNRSGEVIDRKEVSFQTLPAAVASTAPVETSRETTAPYETRPTASTAAPTAPSTLPQTGSAAPRFAAAGLALTAVGLLLVKKAR